MRFQYFFSAWCFQKFHDNNNYYHEIFFYNYCKKKKKCELTPVASLGLVNINSKAESIFAIFMAALLEND